LLDKPDWRERTAQDEVASTWLLFTGGQMRSPVLLPPLQLGYASAHASLHNSSSS
jgi:hypothetical protein